MAKTPAKKAKESEQQLEYNDDFAAEIAKRIDSLVDKGTRGQVVAQVVSLVSESRYSGPIPHQIGKKYGFLALIAIIAASLIAGIFVGQILAGLFLGAGILGIIGNFMRNRSQNNNS